MMFTRKATLAATLAAIITLAPAAASAVTLNIPEQTMAGALKSLSEQAGVQIIFSPDAVEGKRAPAISGDLTPGQALQKILGNSGLGYKANGEGTFAVQAQNNVSPKADSMLDEVVVTATKTAASTREVPFAVSVVTADAISQQSPKDISDILRREAGVDINRSTPLGVATVSVRGGDSASQRTQVLIDGQPSDFISTGVGGLTAIQIIDPLNVERVEIVRGAGSALYGPGAVGVLAVVDRYPAPFGGQLCGNGRADAGGGAGDDGYGVLEFHEVCSLKDRGKPSLRYGRETR